MTVIWVLTGDPENWLPICKSCRHHQRARIFGWTSWPEIQRVVDLTLHVYQFLIKIILYIIVIYLKAAPLTRVDAVAVLPGQGGIVHHDLLVYEDRMSGRQLCSFNSFLHLRMPACLPEDRTGGVQAHSAFDGAAVSLTGAVSCSSSSSVPFIPSVLPVCLSHSS